VPEPQFIIAGKFGSALAGVDTNERSEAMSAVTIARF
jgi:hypothetical protein